MSGRRAPRNHHDALARRMLSRPMAAAVLLRHVLPERFLAHLDLDTLHSEPTDHIDAALANRRSDLLFSVRLRGTHRRIGMYIALEHQSTRDALMPLRMLEYIVRTWTRHVEHQPQPPKTLPFILPILIVQPRARTTPNHLSAILAVPAELRDAFGVHVEVSLLVDDLTGSVLNDPVADAITIAIVELTRVLLRAHGTPKTLTKQRIARLVPLLRRVAGQEDPGDIDAFSTYIEAAFGKDSPLFQIIRTIIDERRSEMYSDIRHDWIAKTLGEGRAEGLAEGLAKGLAKGRAEGQRQCLLDVLKQRGLPLPSAVQDRILTTNDEGQLSRWFQRALTAASIDEIFRPLEPSTGATR